MPTPHTRDWIDYFTAFAPFIAVLFGIGVGAMQAYLQWQSVNQTLFDKRYKVYESVDAFLTNVITPSGFVNSKVVTDLLTETAHAEFLFGNDVVEFIDTVSGKAKMLAEFEKQMRLHAIADDESIRRVPLSVERPNLDAPTLSNAQAEITVFLFQAHMKENAIFRPYLRLHQDDTWFKRFEDRMDKKLKELERRQSE